MKITTTCMRCLQENGIPNLATLGSAAIPDDGVIRLECADGHASHMVLQQDRFELLSELAVTAIVDGYYREAVASFSASLERLYEFYLRISFAKRAVPQVEFDKSWKELGNLSERQLGAFVAVWLADHGAHPLLLDQKKTAFRNAVIHKGKCPSRDEAIEYGQSVADVVAPILHMLCGNTYIDIDEGRPAAWAVQALAAAHAAGAADVAVVAMSASEKQRDRNHIRNFSQFESRLTTLGLGHLRIILPMAYFDISFWDRCLFSTEDAANLERKIHSLLFPTMQYRWGDYCVDAGINPSSSSLDTKWRNCKCDVQAVWSHIHAKRQVFVTGDRNFHRKKSGLIGLGAGSIEYPQDALRLV